jgi:hypothetical protein
VLSRIEVELCHHGGNDNGDLIVTYEQFIEYGIGRDQIGPAIRECVELGFLRVTQLGVAGNANEKQPNKFRLTYRGSSGEHAVMGDGSHEWRQIATMPEAKAIAKAARDATPLRAWRQKRQPNTQAYWRPKNRKPVGKTRPIPVGEMPTDDVTFPVGETRSGPVGEMPTTIYISGGRPPSQHTSQRQCDGCGRSLEQMQDSARFCSNACRQRAYRTRHGSTVRAP